MRTNLQLYIQSWAIHFDEEEPTFHLARYLDFYLKFYHFFHVQDTRWKQTIDSTITFFNVCICQRVLYVMSSNSKRSFPWIQNDCIFRPVNGIYCILHNNEDKIMSLVFILNNEICRNKYKKILQCV